MLGTILIIILTIVTAIFLIWSGVMAFLAAQSAAASPTYNNNSLTQSAYRSLIAGAILQWIVLLLLALIIILAFVFGLFSPRETPRGMQSVSFIYSISLLVIVGLNIVALILISIGAFNLGHVSPRDGNVQTAYNDAVIAAIVSIVATLLLIGTAAFAWITSQGAQVVEYIPASQLVYAQTS